MDFRSCQIMAPDSMELKTLGSTVHSDYDAVETGSWRDTGDPQPIQEDEDEEADSRQDDIIYQVRVAKDAAGSWEVVLIRREKPALGKMNQRIEVTLSHNSLPHWYEGFSPAGFVRSLMSYRDTAACAEQEQCRSRSGSDPGLPRERGRQLFWNILWNEWLPMSTIWRTLGLLAPEDNPLLKAKFEMEMKNLGVPFFSDDNQEETSFVEMARREKKRRKSSPYHVPWNFPMYTIDEQRSLKLEAPPKFIEDKKQTKSDTKSKKLYQRTSGMQDEKMVKVKFRDESVISSKHSPKQSVDKQQEAYRAWNNTRHNHIPFVGVWGFNSTVKAHMSKPPHMGRKPQNKSRRTPQDRLKIYPTNVSFEDSSGGTSSPDVQASPPLSQKPVQKSPRISSAVKDSPSSSHRQCAGTISGHSPSTRNRSAVPFRAEVRERSSSSTESGQSAGSGFMKGLPKGRVYRCIKSLVIGDSCVGKTKFITKLVHRQYLPDSTTTLGVDFALKVVHWSDNLSIKLQLWDIAGQERFTSMTRVYYKDARACIIMFDLSQRSTFLNALKWKNDLDSKCTLPDGNPVPCILLANKCDLNLREVTQDEIETFTQEHSFIGWTEISVKEGLMVDESMQYLLEKVMEQSAGLEDSGNLEEQNRISLANQRQQDSGSKCMC